MIGQLRFNWLWVLYAQGVFFVHSTYVWRKYMHEYRDSLTGMETVLDGSKCLVLMYVQRLGWSYVITPGMKRLGTQRWQTTLECHHVQERILNCLSCIYSWHHTVQFRICTRTFTITVTECVQRTDNFVTILNYTLLSRSRIRARFVSTRLLHPPRIASFTSRFTCGRRTGW